jgi:hypothetical protein
MPSICEYVIMVQTQPARNAADIPCAPQNHSFALPSAARAPPLLKTKPSSPTRCRRRLTVSMMSAGAWQDVSVQSLQLARAQATESDRILPQSARSRAVTPASPSLRARAVTRAVVWHALHPHEVHAPRVQKLGQPGGVGVHDGALRSEREQPRRCVTIHSRLQCAPAVTWRPRRGLPCKAPATLAHRQTRRLSYVFLTWSISSPIISSAAFGAAACAATKRRCSGLLLVAITRSLIPWWLVHNKRWVISLHSCMLSQYRTTVKHEFRQEIV